MNDAVGITHARHSVALPVIIIRRRRARERPNGHLCLLVPGV